MLHITNSIAKEGLTSQNPTKPKWFCRTICSTSSTWMVHSGTASELHSCWGFFW